MKTAETSKKGKVLKRLIAQPEVGVFIPFAILFIVTALGNKNFLTMNNLTSVLRLLTCYAFCALGETLVILGGDIDISVGQTAGMGAMIASVLCCWSGWNIWIAIIISIIICAGFGLIKGFLVAKLNMFPYIATLSFIFISKGIKFIITNGYSVYPFPPEALAIAKLRPLGLKVSFYFMLVCFIVFEFLLRRTMFGRKIYATGDNREVAKLAGINILKVRITNYVICSILCAIAGIWSTLELSVGDPSLGEGWEMYAIAGSAIGGIALKGGKGSLIGTFIGVMFISLLNNTMVMFNVNSNYQIAITGVLLCGAVLIDMFRNSRKLKAN